MADPQDLTLAAALALVHLGPHPGHLLPPPAARAGSAELPLATFCCGRPFPSPCVEELKCIYTFSSYSEHRTRWSLAGTSHRHPHIFGTAMLFCELSVKGDSLRRTVNLYSVEDGPGPGAELTPSDVSDRRCGSSVRGFLRGGGWAPRLFAPATPPAF